MIKIQIHYLKKLLQFSGYINMLLGQLTVTGMREVELHLLHDKILCSSADEMTQIALEDSHFPQKVSLQKNNVYCYLRNASS